MIKDLPMVMLNNKIYIWINCYIKYNIQFSFHFIYQKLIKNELFKIIKNNFLIFKFFKLIIKLIFKKNKLVILAD